MRLLAVAAGDRIFAGVDLDLDGSHGYAPSPATSIRSIRSMAPSTWARRVWWAWRSSISSPSACNVAAALFEVASMRARALSRSEEHTSELQSLMRISYAVFCLQKKT